jgi:hypothetical protein
MPATVNLTRERLPLRPETTARPRTAWEQDYQERIELLYDSRYVDFPQQVGIETLARCNAACNFCPYPTMTRKGERMSDELIAKVLRDLRGIPSDLPFDFYPVRVNEPLLDVRLFDILADLNRDLPNAHTCLFTNASALTDAALDRLARVRSLKTFNISFNDHRKDEYERVMQLDYDRTLAAIDRFHARLAAGEISCQPSISRVCDGTPADLDFRDWVKARWPRVEVWLSGRMDWMGAVDTEASKNMPPTGCRQWFGIHFLANGKDAFCCTDHDAALGFGNVADAHVLDLYNRPERRRLRERALMRQQVPECDGCALWA